MGNGLINATEAWTSKEVEGIVKSFLNVVVDELVGTFVPSGAQNSLATEEINISSSSWTEITLGKAERNALNIQNRYSGADTGADDIYISGTNTDNSPIPKGMKIQRGAERQYAISNVAIYVKAKTTDTVITVEALG